MEWYKLSDTERVKKVYSKHTLKDFWEWWGTGNSVMEIRIQNYKLIVQIAKKFSLPYSVSGVYVRNHQELQQAIREVRKTTNAWFGINPRKKNWIVTRRGKVYKGFGGGDNFIESISHIFIDIDRIKKTGVATAEDLENCNKMCDIILDKLSKQKWNESYCKICSGHGVQLLIKLDVPIKLPTQIFDTENKCYHFDQEFNNMKNLIKFGIGKQILGLIKKHKKDLGVEVDSTGFNMGRVGALPATKNFKYETARWRAIVDIKKGTNIGLSDYLLLALDDMKTFSKKNFFTSKAITRTNIIKKGKLKEHPLANFLLKTSFPKGGINNTLWFSLKILLRDSNVDLQSKEFRDYYNAIKKKHNRTFTLNFPDKNMQFNENTVNNFCINNGFPPLYPLWPEKNRKINTKITYFDLDIMIDSPFVIDIPIKETTNIFEDMEEFQKRLIPGVHDNNSKMAGFLLSLIKKYGKKQTKYYYEHLFERYFDYK